MRRAARGERASKWAPGLESRATRAAQQHAEVHVVQPHRPVPGKHGHRHGHPELTVVQLPPYAPELNATEGVWAHVKRDLGNLLAGTVDELAASAKRLLKRIQYRPELIDGFRAQTGLALQPQPP